jgi:ABC-2 type transport system permease protein
VSPRLFLEVASMEARRRMSYRVDFWLNALVGFAAEFGVVYFLWQAMYAESGKTVMGGYTFEALIFYYVVIFLFAKIVRGVEFDNHVAQDIYEGGLNRYLVMPTSYFGFKYAQHLGSLLPALIQLALLGGVSILALDLAADVDIHLGGLLMAAGSLLLANLLYFLLSFPLQTTAFWADNVWSLLVALRFVTGLLGGLMVPLSLFPDWAREANAWLPFRCLFAVPVEAVMGRLSFGDWAFAMSVGLLWIVLLAMLDAAVWRRGNLQYSGIGI